jgi:hypothetical protein
VGGRHRSRTDGSRLNHVADGEPLDSLVLGSATGAVGAAHGLDVAAAVLVATAKESISLTFHIQTIFEVQSPLSHVPQRASVGLSNLRVSYVCVSLPSASLRRSCRMGDCVANLWEETILLGCPLLDHFDGLFCGRSEIRSRVSGD